MRNKAISLVMAALVVLSGCTNSGASNNDKADKNSAKSEALQADQVAQHCTPPTTTVPVQATAADSTGRDFDVASFDGTKIRAHWFANPTATDAHKAPTVFMGPGWSLAGATDLNQSSLLGSIDIKALLDAGYNVLTWDPRGFGASGGYATVDFAANEGRDVQQLIDWVATLPGVQLDSERDPRMGMVGGSYGGGIQLVTAAIDCRVDAIVPIVAWHSLRTSLYKNDTVKIGWAGVLARAAMTSKLDAHIVDSWETSQRNGTLSQDDLNWFIERGPGDLVKKIRVPTLLIHGTIDTLFTLDEAITNYSILANNNVPVAMLWNCDGHGICLTNPGDPERAKVAAIKWLNHYVKKDKTVELGPGFDMIDQNGKRYVAKEFSADSKRYVEATGKGTLNLIADGGSGPIDASTVGGQLLSSIASDITPAPAKNALEVSLSVSGSKGDTLLLGAPRLSLTYVGKRGGDQSTPRPERVFAQLVDKSTGLVVGNQVTPIEVNLDEREHTAEVPLEVIAQTLAPGSTLTLQIVAKTVAYATPALGGSITFSKVELSVPVGDWVQPAN